MTGGRCLFSRPKTTFSVWLVAHTDSSFSSDNGSRTGSVTVCQSENEGRGKEGERDPWESLVRGFRSTGVRVGGLYPMEPEVVEI